MHNVSFVVRSTSALDILVQHHDTYMTLMELNPDLLGEIAGTVEEFAGSENVDRNAQLHEAENLQDLQRVFRTLWNNNDVADREDVLLMDVHADDHYHHSSFLIDWRAKKPMGKCVVLLLCCLKCVIILVAVCFIDDKIPVESLAFPYLFWKGASGTYGHNKRYDSIVLNRCTKLHFSMVVFVGFVHYCPSLNM